MRPYQYRYKKTNVKHFYKNRAHKEKTAIKIFDPEAPDLSYISNNPQLLRRHITFINKCREWTFRGYTRFTVPEGKCAGMHSQIFEGFRERYPTLYELWMHIIRSCLDKTYSFYPYFGAKGIYPGKDFLDSRQFAIWCLRNDFVGKPFTYTMYLQRKNKKKGYTIGNCYFVTEKEAHAPTKLSSVINSIRLLKLYEENHNPDISYLTFYTRYYMYDMDEYDSRMAEYSTANNFSPVVFYDSVADENSCSQSTFLSRMHYSYLNGGFIARPYDMLNPEYSVKEEANKQGKLSYKQQYDRNKKEEAEKADIYNNSQTDNNLIYNNTNNNVYSTDSELNVYS